MPNYWEVPRVSVVITVYNACPYLAVALDSVRAQTFRDWEIIAVNDGSTDGSRAVLDSFAAREPRIRVIHQPNQGAAAATNAGLAAAAGEFVALLDGDDRFHQEKLAEHVLVLDREPGVDLTFSWSDWIDSDGRAMGIGSRQVTGVFSFADLLEDFTIGNTSSVVLRRSCLARSGPCDLSLTRFYDFDLFLRVAHQRPSNVIAVPRALTYYRRHAQQMSRDWRGMEEEWKRVSRQLLALEPGAERAFRAGQSNMGRYFAYLAYESSQYRDAAELLHRSLRSDPRLFLQDSRNWKVAAAVMAGILLPAPLHRALRRAAGAPTQGVA